MGVPSTRTPVRIARGTYANLTTVDALAALEDGEICFATDLGRLYVKQSGILEAVSATTNADPAPGDVTASPAFASGTGTQQDPYIITNGAVPFSGGTLESSQEITLDATAGDIVVLTDNSGSGSGTRFANQDVGIVNSAGKFTFKLKYIDNPGTTTNNTTYTGDLQIGSTYFSWVVVQSNLTSLSVGTATTISGSLASGDVQTSYTGIATGGTTPYTYATRWQRSFNGTDGWFDINGATGTTYTLAQPDTGYYVRSVAKATDSTLVSQGGPLTLDMPSASSGQININTAPVIDTVGLTTTSGSNRFTSKDFDITVNMNTEGVPTSVKGTKVTLSGSFTQYPETDNVSNVTVNDPINQSPSQYYYSEWSYAGRTLHRMLFNSNGNEWIFCPGSVNYSTLYTTGSVQNSRSSTNAYTYPASSRTYGTSFNYGPANQFFMLGYWNDSSNTRLHKGPSISTMSVAGNNNAHNWYWAVTSENWTFVWSTNLTYDFYGYNTSVDNINQNTSYTTSWNHFLGSTSWRIKNAWFQGTKFFFIVVNTSNSYRHYLKYWDTADYIDTSSISGQIVDVIDFNSLGYTFGNTYSSMDYYYHFAINESSFCAGDATIVWIGDVDGSRWLQLSGTNFSTVTARYPANGKSISSLGSLYCVNNRLYHFTHEASNNYYIRVMTSDNNGASWTTRLTQNGNSSDGGSYWANGASTRVANGQIAGGTWYSSSYGYTEYVNDRTMDVQVASGQNLSNNEIRAGDTVRQGSVSATISSINTGTNTLTFGSYRQPFTTGSPLVNTISHSGANTSTLYAVLNSAGQISDLTTTDPGFVDYGPGTTDTITFPAILPTTYTPDQELPAGTTIKVDIRATNSSGTDTESSPTITPA